jgi:hypothetical protein
MKVSAAQITAQTGTLDKADIANAGAIHASLPEPLRVAAYSQKRSVQVIFALALSADADARSRQLGIVEKYTDAATRAGIEELAAGLAQLHPLQRLPLAQLAFPALRRRPRPALQSFLVALNHVIQTDGKVELEEYCLGKLIVAQVMDAPTVESAADRSVKLPLRAAELADVFRPSPATATTPPMRNEPICSACTKSCPTRFRCTRRRRNGCWPWIVRCRNSICSRPQARSSSCAAWRRRSAPMA